MLTKDEIKNILFFLNNANITGQQAITLAVLQTKLSNMLSNIEAETERKALERKEMLENLGITKEQKLEEPVETKEENKE